MKRCKLTLLTTFVENMDRRLKESGIPLRGQYIDLLLAQDSLSPEMYEEYKRDLVSKLDSFIDWSDIYTDVDAWLDDVDHTKTQEINVGLSPEAFQWLEDKSKAHKITKTKYIAILICKDTCHEEAYMNYRSILDKVWLYHYFRTAYDNEQIHPDDPDQTFHRS